MKLVRRRLYCSMVALVAVVITIAVFQILMLSLLPHHIYSGWLLCSLVIFLCLFSIRKKLNFLPLGTNSAWAQFHYYVGYFSLATFLLHVDYLGNRSTLEQTLFILFHITLGIGILGLLINRLFARRLAALSQEIIYEEIPTLIKSTRMQVEDLIQQGCKKSNSSTLGDYYIRHLDSFFRKSANRFFYLFGLKQQSNKIIDHLHQQHRYLDGTEIEFAIQLEKLIRQKALLDTHFTLQGIMKYWSVLHYPIGFGLVLLTSFHVIVIYAFSSTV